MLVIAMASNTLGIRVCFHYNGFIVSVKSSILDEGSGMRIVSKFKDYYDSSAGFGVDMSQVFVRKQEAHSLMELAQSPDFSLLEKELSRTMANIRHLRSESYSPVIVGFCGKLYVGLKAPKITESGEYEYSGSGMSRSVVQRIYWSPGEFPDEALNKKVDHFSLSLFLRRQHNTVETIADWFEMNKKELVRECSAAFAGANQVVFFYDPYANEPYAKQVKNDIVINPCLQDYGFQRVKDPFSAFQEISMFIGGVLSGPERDTITLCDQDRIVAHGFDDKSFRKPATKKARR